ncbi:ribosomal large subunit pseudouridine synthase D [Ligilactobacillus salitolerans]|uniref:Pseudouridine synthase n=1 Tax=Ligilactobacillus salitolerans TaxID=1808352 RepID=A0A401IVW8_9LACO|nr:RluA family pseudouridine synthase [Ligilactobacillus salitolerans]GBG95655.1 ribosomal large subunit pseudouridine synthase D [Ligilactobacillus salitolerans]
MKFVWKFEGLAAIKLKSFLQKQGVSRRLLAKVRHEGGQILVDNIQGRTVDKINPGQTVALIVPPEHGRKSELRPSFVPLEIIYEDQDLLAVNKPPFLPSVPSPLYPGDSLVNRVCGYYQVRSYQGIVPHIVSRLDRDTSGVVLFAKHRYAHALLDQQMQARTISKEYTAFLQGTVQAELEISQPIGRDPESLFKRRVDPAGKKAQTSLKLLEVKGGNSMCQLRPKTGRTHQLRVHCAYIGHPLLGDTMYNGPQSSPLERQALHCHRFTFAHPLTGQKITLTAPVAQDMQQYWKKL